MRYLRICLVVVAGMLVATVAGAWGRDGHRIIGEIAWHYLTPDARHEVERLTQQGRYDSLGEVGNWADAFSRLYDTYDERSNQHYIDIAPEADGVDMARDCPHGCIIEAIHDLESVVADRSLPKAERAEAFFFLVHFIEDIHQPLHVIHPDMTGGNETEIVFFGRRANVHRLWDSLMIGRRLGDYERADEPSACERRPWECGPWERWAHDLRFTIGATEAVAWRQDLEPESWANEVIAPSREWTFKVQNEAELGEEYYSAMIPVVEQQLQKAAIRLAGVLNELFTK
jgi:hypothetical protein